MGEGHIEESLRELALIAPICLLEILKSSLQFTPRVIKQESMPWPVFPIRMCPPLRYYRVESQWSLENS